MPCKLLHIYLISIYILALYSCLFTSIRIESENERREEKRDIINNIIGQFPLSVVCFVQVHFYSIILFEKKRGLIRSTIIIITLTRPKKQHKYTSSKNRQKFKIIQGEIINNLGFLFNSIFYTIGSVHLNQFSKMSTFQHSVAFDTKVIYIN